MTRQQQAELLKKKIYDIQESKNKKEEEPDKVIVTCYVASDLFIEMAHCFIAKYGK